MEIHKAKIAALIAIVASTGAHAREYVSDWGKDYSSGGYWVKDADSTWYINRMVSNGDQLYSNPAVVYNYPNPDTTKPYLGWFLKSNKLDDKWVPPGMIQIGDGDGNSDYLIHSAIIERVGKRRSGGYVTPWSKAVASCRTSPANITDELWFASTSGGTVSQGLSYDHTIKTGTKISSTFGSELGFDKVGKISTSVTTELSKEWSQSQGETMSESWSDSRTYTTKQVVGWSITPGTIGSPAVSTPVAQLFGLFRLNRIWFNGTLKPWVAVSKTGQGYHPIYPAHQRYTREDASWWLGKIEVPVTYLKSIPGYTGTQIENWFVNSPTMTVNQYKTYCQGDMASRTYAAAMKPALCKAGIDVLRTCRG